MKWMNKKKNSSKNTRKKHNCDDSLERCKKNNDKIIDNRHEVAHEMHANMKKWIINWEFLSFYVPHKNN